jgi:aminopeptidase N
LSLIAQSPGHGALARVRAEFESSSFDRANPNRMRSLIGAFAMANPTGFHRPDGAGYAFFADRIIEFDTANPQVAARMLTALRSWKSMAGSRRELLRAQIARIANTPGLSRDCNDIAGRMLG